MTMRTLAAAWFFVGGWLGWSSSTMASDWISTASGSWSNSANWSSGVPNGVGATAVFPFTNSSNDFQVQLTSDVTLGSLISSSYRLEQINGPGKLIFDASTPGVAPLLKMGLESSGSVRINSQVILADNALHLDLPTQSHRVFFMQGFAPTNANLTLDGLGEITFVGDYSGWTGSLLLDSGSASFYGSAAADVILDGGGLTLRADHLGDVIFKKGGLSPVSGALSGKLVLEAGNSAHYESGRDFQILGGSEGPGDFVVRGSRNLVIGGAGLGHAGNLQILVSNVRVAAPLHHAGGTVLLSAVDPQPTEPTRLTIDALGSLVGSGLTTVNVNTILSVAEPAGNDSTLHSASPNSVTVAGGGLSLGGDFAPAALLHPDSTGGTLLIHNVANYTAGGQTLDFTQLPNGANWKLAADNFSSSEASGLGAGLQIIPANNTFRFGVGNGTLTVHASLGDTNGAANALNLESDNGTQLAGLRLAAANTYSGVTTVTGGLLEVNHSQALGSTSAGTVVNGNRSFVEINAPVAEPFEVNGGMLTLKSGSEGTTSPIRMNGGQVRLDYAGTFGMPLTLGAGTNSLGGTSPTFGEQQRATFTGGSSGEGELSIANVIVSGAPLAHDGGLRLSAEVALESANTYTGPTTVQGSGGIVWVRHPQALGDPTQVVTIADGSLTLEAAVVNPIIVKNGTLISELAVAATGPITLQPGNGKVADIFGPGHIGDVAIASDPGGSAILRSGEFDGVISGSSRLTMYGGSLNGDNTYTGLTVAQTGDVDVNHGNGLGSTDLGTFVDKATLNLNAAVDEPILISGWGTVNVNAQIGRLPLSAPTTAGQFPGSGGKVRINAPGTYDESLDLVDTQLEVNAPTTIGGVYLRGAEAGLKVAPGQTLQLGDGGLTWHSGTLSGQLAGTGALHKLGVPTSKLTGEFSYDGEIVVDRGQLEVATTGTTTTTLTVPNPYASLRMVQGRTYDGDIYLHGLGENDQFGKDLNVVENSQYQGPLVLNGSLNVAGKAAISGRQVAVMGPVQGDSLISYGQVDLHNANNTYTGATVIWDGAVTLRGAGRITNSSEIIVHRGSGFGVYNEQASDPSDRVNDAIPITMRGGSIGLRSPSGVLTSEAFGALEFAGSISSVGAEYFNAGNPAAMQFATLARQPGTAAEFHVRDNFQIALASPPDLDNGIIGAWAMTVDDLNYRRFATYGVDGIRPLNSYSTDIHTASATDNVLLSQTAWLSADATIHSLTGEGFGVRLDLDGHKLTVMSGGLLHVDVDNGELTAGDAPGAELIMGAGGNANIVDNAQGPVNVVFPYGGQVGGSNSYSGSTSVLSHELNVLTETALPEGTELRVDGGAVTFHYLAAAPKQLDELVLREGGILRSGFNGRAILAPTVAILEDGRIENVQLVGDGEIIKRGPGTVELGAADQIADFSGTVAVEEGALMVGERGLASVPITISGGVFFGPRTDTYEFTNSINLNGGALAVSDNEFRGTVTVTDDSVLLGMHAASSHFDQGGAIAGNLSGDGDLTVETGVDAPGLIRLGGNNQNYHGNVAINGGTLRIGQNSSLGTGDVTISPGGRLELENAVTTNPVTVRGGELFSRATPATLTGLVTVEERAFIGCGVSELDLVLSGGMRLLEDARVNKVGEGKLTIGGSIFVNGQNTIFAPRGQLEIDGVIVPETEGAVLDIITGNFDDAPLSMSLVVPEGTSIGIRQFGGPAVVRSAGAGRYLAGNGTIFNEISVSNAGELRPGASVGALTVAMQTTWGAGGVYAWEIDDALGQPGGDHGWDVLHVQDGLNILATEANPFVVRVESLALNGGAGLPEHFNPLDDYAWVIATATELTGFSLDALSVDDTSFREMWGADPLGEFALEQAGSDVVLAYVPPTSIPGDAWPFDGRVGINELNAVRNNFGTIGSRGMAGDLYPFDGRVDIRDLNLARNNFGARVSANTPEPATILTSVLCIALCTAMGVTRRFIRTGDPNGTDL